MYAYAHAHVCAYTLDAKFTSKVLGKCCIMTVSIS